MAQVLHRIRDSTAGQPSTVTLSASQHNENVRDLSNLRRQISEVTRARDSLRERVTALQSTNDDFVDLIARVSDTTQENLEEEARVWADKVEKTASGKKHKKQ